jgi:hypothetical protein
VRRHAKASTAGKGSGAPSSRRLLRATLAVLALVLLALALIASTASAAQTRSHTGSFGSFTGQSPRALAIDQSSGDVYVVDQGNQAVLRFDSAGNPAPFSALSGSNVIDGAGGADATPQGGFALDLASQVAVDNSGGATDGNIYIADSGWGFSGTHGTVDIFNPSGTYVGQLDGSTTPQGAWAPNFGWPCGVAVTPDGTLYVSGSFNGTINRYTPSGAVPSDTDYDAQITGIFGCGLGADSAGSVYEAQNTFGSSGNVIKYAASDFGTSGPPGTVIEPNSVVSAISLDPSTNELYADEGDHIQVFDPTGGPSYTFGSAADFGSSAGVAVKGSGGNAYVSDQSAGEIDVFDPSVHIPDATTDAATAIGPTTATLNGTVNPDGVQLTECHFEYTDDADFQANGFTNATNIPCSPDAASIPADSSDHSVSADASGLAADTTYHFRLLAANADGTVNGGERTFTTPQALVVTTGDATNLDQTTATLNGTVNPLGAEVTDCHFDYTDDTDFQANGFTNAQPASCAETVGSGTSDVPVHADLTGLSGSTLYHFRLQATNANGTVAGSDRTLTTPGPPLATTGLVLDPTDTSATLSGRVDPDGFATTYFFQYATQPDFSDARSVPASEDADAGSGTDPVQVAQTLTGLQPDTTYYWRLRAANSAGADTALAPRPFSTLPPPAPPAPCPNAELRTGPSASLPDCRAYELVTPPDTQGVTPSGRSMQFNEFDTPLTSPDGSRVRFGAFGEALPGTNGNGNIDVYTADRGPNGWLTSLAGPTGAQAEFPKPGGSSPDLLYSTWSVLPLIGDRGSLAAYPSSSFNNYLRGPDGSFTLVGQGSLGVDPNAQARWVTPGAGHLIFNTGGSFQPPVQLEPDAPPTGTAALYDRSADGPTRVVSLLPGDVTPAAGQDAFYQGVSEDGSAVAFQVESDPSLYVRLYDAATYQVTSQPNTFAGLSADGGQLFYADANTDPYTPATPADLFSFDTASQTATQITTGGGARFVNVSADGSHVYFVSTQQLAPNVAAGADNLYVWDRDSDQTSFIAVLDPGDVDDSGFAPSLTKWINGPAQHNGVGKDPSRTTPDGSVLLFESRARLTSYDNQGHTEIYRYAAGADTLTCVSCNPTGAPPGGDAHLQGDPTDDPQSPTSKQSLVPNLTPDGRLVAFQTDDALSPKDVNGAQDVYTWHDGKLALISTGQSLRDSFLYAITPDGHDLFFTTFQQLVSQDHNGGARTIYDARVDGGFPPDASPAPCVGDACQGPASPPPSEPLPGSSGFTGPGNQGKSSGNTKRKCGKQKTLKHGKCAPKKNRRNRK